MISILRVLALVGVVHTGLLGSDNTKFQEQMFANLDILYQSFEVKYAPSAWKKVCFDWVLTHEVLKQNLNSPIKLYVPLKTFKWLSENFLQQPMITIQRYNFTLLKLLNFLLEYKKPAEDIL